MPSLGLPVASHSPGNSDCVCARVRVRALVHVLLERDSGSKPGLQVPGSVQLCGLWASCQRGHLYPQLSSGLGAKVLSRLGPSSGLFCVSLATFALRVILEVF